MRLHREAVPGESAELDADDNLINHAHISCTSAEIFNQVKEGEPIFFDDGKIEGVIREVNQDEMIVKSLTPGKEEVN